MQIKKWNLFTTKKKIIFEVEYFIKKALLQSNFIKNNR